jgi:hypothetical protein
MFCQFTCICVWSKQFNQLSSTTPLTNLSNHGGHEGDEEGSHEGRDEEGHEEGDEEGGSLNSLSASEMTACIS